MRRLTIFVDEHLERQLTEQALAAGAVSCASMPCRALDAAKVRLEILGTPAAAEQMMTYLRREIVSQHRVAACVDMVDALPLEPLGRDGERHVGNGAAPRLGALPESH
jgi:hypothetical protein